MPPTGHEGPVDSTGRFVLGTESPNPINDRRSKPQKFALLFHDILKPCSHTNANDAGLSQRAQVADAARSAALAMPA